MKKLNLLFLFLIPLIARAQSHCVTIRGNTTNGKFKQVNVSTETPNVSDSSMPEIDDLSWDDGNGPYTMRSYLRYDVSEIPAGSVIISATLHLRAKVDNIRGWTGFPTLDENESWLKRVTSAWTPAAISWNNQPSVDDATAVMLAQSTDSSQDYAVNVKAFVESWINNPGSNNGMQLRIIHEEYNDGSLVFASGQAPDSLQPTLDICYQPGSNGCTAGFRDTLYAVGRSTHYFTLQTDSSAGRVPVQVCWSWGDSTSNCFTYDSTHPYTGAPFAHTYPDEHSTYIACVTVRYQDSCSAIYCNYTTIPSTCTAGFTYTAEGPENRKYYFVPSASNSATKAPVRITWSWGDGSANTVVYYDSAHPYHPDTVIHTYIGNNPYQSCVTVQYQDSCSATWCDSVPPSAQCDDQVLTIRGSINDSRYQQAVIIRPDPFSESPEPYGADDASENEIDAGYWRCDPWTNTCVRNSLIRYDLSELPQNAIIHYAYLYLYAKTDNNYGVPGRPMFGLNTSALQRVTSPWSQSTVHWSIAPHTDWAYEQILAESSTPKNYAVDVTGFVRGWVSRADSNYGMMLSNADDYSVSASMVFHSGLAPDSLKPRLKICYSLPGDTETAWIATAGEPLSLRLYPNPATNALTLQVRSSKPQAGAVFLYDLQGRLLQVLKSDVPLAVGNNIIHAAIDRRNVPAGLYFVKVQMGSTMRTYKVTIR